eukprot:14150709-Alexandrium_andersonii.AAC.1
MCIRDRVEGVLGFPKGYTAGVPEVERHNALGEAWDLGTVRAWLAPLAGDKLWDSACAHTIPT